jgi:hypothetical protein
MLPIHCLFSACSLASLPIHCPFTAYLLPFCSPLGQSLDSGSLHYCIQCLRTAYALPAIYLRFCYGLRIHCLFCLFMTYSLTMHCLFTAYLPLPFYPSLVRTLDSGSLPSPTHCLSLPIAFTAYLLLAAYSLPIHCLFTAYSLPIHCLFCLSTAYSATWAAE